MAKLAQIGARLWQLTDARYRRFYWQRRCTDIPGRQRRTARLAAALPRFEGATTQADRSRIASLDRDGFAVLDNVLPLGWLAALHAYFAGCEVADPYRPNSPGFVGPQNAPPGTHVAFVAAHRMARAPHVFDIVNHPAVLATAAGMLGARPIASYMAAWWSLAAGDGEARHAELFHRDVDDWRFVKLFCYLTDVDEDAGPHVFVPGSHRINRLTSIRRYSESEIHAAFGADCEKRFVGPAGTAFLENTYGFHRGCPPRSTPRLIFQVLYSLTPVVYGPRTPVCTIGRDGVPSHIDAHTNSVYCRAL